MILAVVRKVHLWACCLHMWVNRTLFSLFPEPLPISTGSRFTCSTSPTGRSTSSSQRPLVVSWWATVSSSVHPDALWSFIDQNHRAPSSEKSTPSSQPIHSFLCFSFSHGEGGGICGSWGVARSRHRPVCRSRVQTTRPSSQTDGDAGGDLWQVGIILMSVTMTEQH